MSVFRRSTTRPVIAIVASLAILALIILALLPSANDINLSSLYPEQMLEDYNHTAIILSINPRAGFNI